MRICNGCSTFLRSKRHHNNNQVGRKKYIERRSIANDKRPNQETNTTLVASIKFVNCDTSSSQAIPFCTSCIITGLSYHKMEQSEIQMQQPSIPDLISQEIYVISINV